MKICILISALLAGLSPVAEACQICVPFPTKSGADYLLEADVVVLAREDPERPFHFSAVDVLKGKQGTEKIDLFLDSASRRTLAIFPERSIVLARRSEKGKTIWQRVGMTDAEFEPVVRKILDSAAIWEKTPRLRVEFFGKLIGHDDAQISRLAHLEVARAPYSEIKRLKGVLSRDQIHAFLRNYRYMEWHALYILLLAQSQDSEDHKFIWEQFRSAAQFGANSRLAAWATAAIEVDGGKAIEFIEKEYFRNRKRTPEQLKEIAMAFSVHGTNGHTYLRDRIVAAYEILIADHPAMTADIAKDLIAWKRTEMADEIAKYVAANPRRFDFKTMLRLRAYGRQADPLFRKTGE